MLAALSPFQPGVFSIFQFITIAFSIFKQSQADAVAPDRRYALHDLLETCKSGAASCL